jgi:outer membrane protein OmpA-like peptidoglycan-associated protein
MKPWFLLALLWVSGGFLGADPLMFKYQAGDQYRYYGTSTQAVTLDGTLVQNDLLSYKISFSISEAPADGSGHLVGHITYLTQKDGAAGAVTQEYDTDYWVDSFGHDRVPATQVMPVVRNVPTFPDRDLKPGDTWTGQGEEVHDMAENFHIPQLLRVPFDVVYTYEGPVQKDGKTLLAIRSEYSLYKRTGYRYPKIPMYPVLMTGHSSQTHYFNQEKGREEGYDETYSLVLSMNTGQRVEYSGTGESHLIDAVTMDKPAVVDEVKKGLQDRGMGNVEVHQVPQGVVINVDNIQFPGDSAVLVASEREKLRLIGEVLKQYPDRDILVEGHTAIAGSTVDPQTLSEARAAAVGDALVALGVREPEHIVFKGWGGTKPLAPNTTEEGRAKNRRVEITLLEN